MDGDQQEFGDGGGCEPTGRSWWIQPGGEWEQLVQLKTFLQTCNCAKSKNGFGKDNILVGGKNKQWIKLHQLHPTHQKCEIQSSFKY